MALRLQEILGRWVTHTTPNSMTRRGAGRGDDGSGAARARACSPTVLDLPGGMRIDTIHAFCQSLLRRFPLETGLFPHFRLLDEPDAANALTEAREDDLQAPQRWMREPPGRRWRASRSADQFAATSTSPSRRSARDGARDSAPT